MDGAEKEARKEDMNRRLQLYCNGATAHSANKARHYLDKEWLWPHVEAALNAGKWKELYVAMDRLW